MSKELINAQNFCAKFNIKIKISYLKYDYHFLEDKEKRHIFKVVIKKNGKQYTFNFGQSIANGKKEPNIYDILACLQKYDVGSFEDFCKEFGYNNEYINNLLYNKVCKEYKNVDRIFGDCIEELNEIQ
jgi:hypothetical protein